MGKDAGDELLRANAKALGMSWRAYALKFGLFDGGTSYEAGINERVMSDLPRGVRMALDDKLYAGGLE